MKIFPGVLSQRQQAILRCIGPALTSAGFYLGGGTALALRLGHRRSVDFDWFTSNRLPDPLRLAKTISASGIRFVTGQVEKGTLYGRVSGVPFSLLEYRYQLLQPPGPARSISCKLATIQDLAAMKLAAVAQRGAKRDFVDIYALGTSGTSLRTMLHWYCMKYKIEDIGHVLRSLTYFDEADRERPPRLLIRADWRTIKDTIKAWVREVAQ
jgi:hypothetical protein